MNEEQLKQEYQMFQQWLKYQEIQKMHNKVATGNTAQLMHGPGGLFSDGALDPNVFSAMLSPEGLGAILRKVPTIYTQPEYGILTGQEAANGTEPSTACGDPKTAGFKKLCAISARFGKIQRATDTIDPVDIITKVSRGEFNDFRLLGTAGNAYDIGFNPNINADPRQILNNVVAASMQAVAVEYVRVLSVMLWNGAVAGANDGYAEFPGLESQITTGITDVNGTACAAADSDVKDFNFDLVGGSGRDIVEYIETLEYFVTDIARRAGINGVEWVWVMRRELWEELSNVWPVAYNTQTAAFLNALGASRLTVDGADMMDRRDAMRNGMMITVRGKQYRVVVDDGITELTNINNANIPAGQYASDIYFIPIRAMGVDVTRIEHLDYRQISPQLSVLNTDVDFNFWTNDGMYLWDHRDGNARCFQIAGITQPRVVCQTPHIAGRIQNVRYQPLQHLRSPYPDNPYFVNGGVSTQPISTVSQVWS